MREHPGMLCTAVPHWLRKEAMQAPQALQPFVKITACHEQHMNENIQEHRLKERELITESQPQHMHYMSLAGAAARDQSRVSLRCTRAQI